MKLNDILYKSVEDIWDKFYTHPFLKEMANNSLPKEKFKFYLSQDYLYLSEYAKIFAIGIIKSDNQKDMQKFLKFLDDTLNKESLIHKKYFKALQILIDSKKDLLNTSYTNYMLSVSLNGDLLDTSVAMLACTWSYKKIADHFFDLVDENNFYKDWFLAYKEDDNLKIMLELIDEKSLNLSKDKQDKLIEIFTNCSLFELKFWDMAYNLGS